jgi:uncharacterized membrane protein YagU involved in acid resistance
MNAVSRGTWSGICATGVMTICFFRLFKLLQHDEEFPLPPAKITGEFSKKIGVDQKLTNRQIENLTLLNHFGYGIACSLPYAGLSQKLKSRPGVSGALYGFLIWGFSYLGLIPALKLRSSAYEMTKQKNLIMILLHIIWGTSLAYSEHELASRGNLFLNGLVERS